MRLVNRDWPAFLAVSWVVFVFSILIAIAVGWVMNIVALTHMSIPPFTGMLILRVVGIFIPPIGRVVGYM